MNWLLILTIFTGIIAISRLLKVMELSAALRGENINEVKDSDSRSNALLWVLFGIGFFYAFYWQVSKYAQFILPESASEHGIKTDNLFDVSMWIITPVFFATHIFLFYYIYKYYKKKNQTATFFAHSTKLELVWTVIPTIVLTSLIIYGIATWNEITTPATKDAQVIELYAKQFDWTARYAGKDNMLGKSSFRLIDGTNTLGIDSTDAASADDKIVRGEFHIPVGETVNFKFHSRDVIHSAYMPHFRAQMNCVPGMQTMFHFVPTITTQEMREKLGNPEFDYVLLCNKICGSAHYNMQMKIVVESKEEFNKWLAEKKTFAQESQPEPVKEEAPVAKQDSSSSVKVAMLK